MWTNHRTWWLDPPHPEKPSVRKTQHIDLGVTTTLLGTERLWIKQDTQLLPPVRLYSLESWALCAWVPADSESVCLVARPSHSLHLHQEGRSHPQPAVLGGSLPLISLVNFTLWESVRGFCCSSILLKSKTSQTNSITGCAL